MKHYIKSEKELYTKGPGQYILKKGKCTKCITYTGTESKVDESQADLTNIHKLLEPAIQRGLLRHSVKYTDEYDDIPAITYQDALQTVATANEMFADLPAKIRKRFNNNPVEFLQFTANPENKDEMQRLGMLKGNDGLTADGQPSGAPTPAAAPAPEPAAEPAAAPAVAPAVKE